MFEYPLDLHYSQTDIKANSSPFRFEYPLDLHYSQTRPFKPTYKSCLNTLWIYTTLKLVYILLKILYSLTSGFTLLSNRGVVKEDSVLVWIPSGFTLLSNDTLAISGMSLFEYPLDLHYSQTSGETSLLIGRFEYPLDLHYSQTIQTNNIRLCWVWRPSGFTLLSNNEAVFRRWWKFEYPLDLHYSQTADTILSITTGLNTLWIYTTLKPLSGLPSSEPVWIPSGFTLLSNSDITLMDAENVWIPSGFTLLSNTQEEAENAMEVWIPSGFTLLSNNP